MLNIKLVKYRTWLEKLMILFLIITATSAAFNGFFSKWAFRDDGSKSFGIEAMIAGTAERPFVYRRLLPETAKLIVASIPPAAKEKLIQKIEKQRPAADLYARSQPPQKYLIEYHVMMLLCYLSLLGTAFLLRVILIKATKDTIAGTLAALLFILLTPYLEVLGGYYYDFPELFFFTLSVYLAQKGLWLGLIILAPFATANKEAYFFFLPMLFPFLHEKYSTQKSVCFLSLAILAAGLTYLWIQNVYALNPGEAIEIHIWQHVKDFFRIPSYYITSTTYGMPLGSEFFFTHVLYVAWIVYQAWPHLPPTWKLHTKLAVAINVPLYLIGAVPGELRNLSMLDIAFSVMLAYFLHDLLQKHYAPDKEHHS